MVDAGVVDENVHAAEGLFGFREEALHIGRFRHVALHRCRLATLGDDVGHGLVGAGLAAGIIHDDRCALRRQRLRDTRANALRRARYDGDLVCQLAHVHLHACRFGGTLDVI